MYKKIDILLRRVMVTMCGRYSLIYIDDLGKRFRVFIPTLGIRSHFNIAPTQMMPVIVQHEHAEMVEAPGGSSGEKTPKN